MCLGWTVGVEPGPCQSRTGKVCAEHAKGHVLDAIKGSIACCGRRVMGRKPSRLGVWSVGCGAKSEAEDSDSPGTEPRVLSLLSHLQNEARKGRRPSHDLCAPSMHALGTLVSKGP